MQQAIWAAVITPPAQAEAALTQNVATSAGTTRRFARRRFVTSRFLLVTLSVSNRVCQTMQRDAGSCRHVERVGSRRERNPDTHVGPGLGSTTQPRAFGTEQ